MGKSTIGSRIRESRENKGLDQSRLSDELGVTTRTLQRWEKGEQIPDAVSVLRIAESTDVQPQWILNGEGDIYNKKVSVSEGRFTQQRIRNIRLQQIPLLASVPAGKPVLNFDEDVIEKNITVDDLRDPDAFALIVKGNSMSPRIEHDDIVVVSPRHEPKNGDICVVRANGEDTLKRVKYEDGFVQLIPLNTSYEPIILKKKEVDFIWKVVKVIKSL